MDAFQARRPIGGDPQQPQSLFWHPPSSSSSSSPIGGYHHHQDPHLARLPSPPSSLPLHQPGYPLHHHHPPPTPQQQPQQQWLHPDSHPHLQQPPPPPSFSPHPPVPPYHAQPPVPPYPSPMPPAPHPYLSPAPPTHPPHRPPTMPPQLAHHHPPPPPTAAYPPPNQGWGNPLWGQHQPWEYPVAERNLPYNNEEDWAARAKAWAAAKSATENHHRQAQIMPTGRIEEHGYAYHEQYQQAAGPPTDNQLPSHLQSSNQQLPVHFMDQQKQVSHVHGSTSFSSGSPFYSTDGRPYYNAEDEASGADKDHMSSSQRNFGPSSSIYEQEVPYCYSSTQGDRESVNQSESLQQPFPASSVQEGFLHSQSTLPVRNISVEQAHFTHTGQSSKLIPDVSDQPLDFQPRSASGLESHPQISYEHADIAGPVGVMDHDAVETSIHSWTPSAAPRVFSHIPLAPTGTQFDPSFASQSSLPGPPAPAYARVPGPNFRPSISPVTPPFALGSGTSLHHAAAFSGDAKAAFNLSERPKKSAVPNWLREEIIKNKSVLANAGPNHQNGSTFHSTQFEDADKSSKGVDQADNKSMESTRSTEDEEDDEDDVEAAKSAAFNQEIKRVLTEVLMKVTDELFDEIATNVLNEDNPTVEVSDHADVENPGVSFPAASTPKTSAKVPVPAEKSNKKIGRTRENSSPGSPREDILGLANYASDDDDDDVDDCIGDDGETQSSNIPSSGMVIDASHQQETSGRVSANVLESVEKGIALVNKEKPSENVHNIKSQRYRTNPNGSPPNLRARDNEGRSVMQHASSSDNNLHGGEKASDRMSRIADVQTSVESRKIFQFSPDSSNALQSNDKAGKESTLDDAKNGKSLSGEGHVRESKSILSNNKHSEKRSNSEYPVKESKAGVGKTVLETSGAKDFTNHEGREKAKKEKRDNSEEKSQDRGAGGKNMRESDSRSSSKHTSARDDRMDVTKDKRRKDKEDCGKKGEQIRDEREDRSTRGMKDEVRSKTRRLSSPSSRVRNNKENSLHGYGTSSDDRSDNSKKRKLQSDRGSLSPSPTKSRIRQVSRSPHSKHSHRRNSYSSLDRRRRSRSTTPVHRRR